MSVVFGLSSLFGILFIVALAGYVVGRYKRPRPARDLDMSAPAAYSVSVRGYMVVLPASTVLKEKYLSDARCVCVPLYGPRNKAKQIAKGVA